MSSELSKQEEEIIQRYLNRKTTLIQTPPTTNPPNTINPNLEASIEKIIAGQPFEDNSLRVALKQALEYATPKGYVATMPELIAAKIKAVKTHDFWKKWYTVHTEENIGIDKKGLHYIKDTPVLVIVNGGGILTPERIQQAYNTGLINGSAKYDESEFDRLLEGKVSDGNIKLYKYEDIKAGIPKLPHRFGIVMPYSTAQATTSGYHQKDAFTTNPLVIARAGGVANLEKYYDLAKNTDGKMGNHHPFSGRDASTPQGRLLFLSGNYGGLDGDDGLKDSGRFVGVAPEAHRAKK